MDSVRTDISLSVSSPIFFPNRLLSAAQSWSHTATDVFPAEGRGTTIGGRGFADVDNGTTTTVPLARFKALTVRITAGRHFWISMPSDGSKLTHQTSPRRILSSPGIFSTANAVSNQPLTPFTHFRVQRGVPFDLQRKAIQRIIVFWQSLLHQLRHKRAALSGGNHLPEPGGTGSSDTKIDNVTIQGISSNDDVYGIYIDKSCCDCKISDTFIYGTKEAIVTKSAGHILNNVHLLAMNTTGGTVRADGENFKETVGIRISTGGFFVFNQVYYDTMDRGIVVDDNFSPDLLLDQQISYSYLNDFGTCFLHAGANSPNLRVKISNSTFTLRNKDYKLLDYSPGMVGWDIADKFSFVNCVVDGLHNLSPYDLTLLQRLRGKAADGLMWNRLDDSGSQWYVLGAVVASPLQNFLEIDLTDELRAKLRFGFKGNGLNVYSYEFEGNDDGQVELGYALHGDFCVWMFRSRKGGSFTPVVYDLLGSGQFMPFPNKGKIYVPADYGVSEADIQVLDHP